MPAASAPPPAEEAGGLEEAEPVLPLADSGADVVFGLATSA